MRYVWKYIKTHKPEFPEIYWLEGKSGESIKVTVNRIRRLVTIQANDGKSLNVQATISNGVVLREQDLNTGRVMDLDNALGKYHRELSSLPDSAILRIIGGNYNVMTEFLGESQKITVKEIAQKANTLRAWFNSLMTRMREMFTDRKSRLFRSPRISDYVQLAFIAFVGYGLYWLNYDYILAGLFVAAASLFSGVWDIVRKKDPCLVTTITLLLPGSFLLAQGYLYQ